jgi:outer membrane protein
MKKSIIASVALLLFASSASADFLGIRVGVGIWNGNVGGDISDLSLDSFNVQDDTGINIYAGFEHPIPLLPNIKIGRTNIKDSGSASLSTSFEFGGTVFTAGERLNTSIDLTHTDVTLYYEIVDVGMDLDVGLTGRYMDGQVAVNGVRQDIDAVLPMVFARAKVGLPFSGVYVGAEVNALSFRGDSVSDYAAKIGWETDSFIFPEFGVEAGYRKLIVDGGSDLVALDADFDGIFLNLTARW